MSSFQQRKESLAHFMHGQATFSEVQNATLLVLDGRHTTFDNIPFSEQMVQQLIKNNVPFIASQNYYHTINVIRPHFIRFVQILQEISAPSLDLVVYVNSLNMVEEDRDELLSVVAFTNINANK
eukprot:926427_1